MSEPILLPAIQKMTLYIPACQELAFLKPRSAIVGIQNNEHLDCAYEGGIFGEMDFYEKLTISCWRLAARSPSTAYLTLTPTQVHPVASVIWDTILRGWVIENFLDLEKLKDWHQVIPDLNGSFAQKQRAAGLLLSSGNSRTFQEEFERSKLAGEDPINALLTLARKNG